MGGVNMKEQRFSRFSVSGVPVVAVLSLAAVVFAGACATTPGTGLDRSQQVFEDYMAGRVSAEHIYYTTGPQNAPDAILGVSRKYTLRSERWAKREMTEATLRETVARMNIAGNLLDVWQNLVEVGNDPWQFGSTRSPSMRFDDVQFSGA